MIELKNLLENICPNIDFERQDLVSAGLIDSLAFVSIISAIEEKYSINIDIMSVEPEDFESLESISAFIERQNA